MFESINVLGTKLVSCSENPKTGFFRDGCCNTDYSDTGLHTVCVQLTDEFLQFSKAQGNDLTTPIPQYGFAGLKAGDKWCLCAARWLEAYKSNRAPKVFLESTHEETLALVPLKILKEFAVSNEA
tara:strand:- start:14417 stop:14791 length:375 start_codon:yes stop_codon:yes gene_type:complete